MVEDGPYEILPYKEIVQLKREIADLKDKTNDINSKDLIDGMHRLSTSMEDLLKLFKAASAELKEESKKEAETSDNVKKMLDKLDESLEENKVIADGILAISDNVEKKFNEVNERIDKIHTETKVMKTKTEYIEPIKPPKMEIQQPVQSQQTKTFESFSEQIMPSTPPMPSRVAPSPNFSPPPMPPPTPSMGDIPDDLFPPEPKKKGFIGRMFKK